MLLSEQRGGLSERQFHVRKRGRASYPKYTFTSAQESGCALVPSNILLSLSLLRFPIPKHL